MWGLFLDSQSFCVQDSLLASPIILDLVILTELCQRITFRPEGDSEFQTFHSVLSLLSYLCKAPLVPAGAPIVNALFRQRACIENIMRSDTLAPCFQNLSVLSSVTNLFTPNVQA